MYDHKEVEDRFYYGRDDVKVIPYDELLKFCNEVRRIGGSNDLLKSLLPSTPGNAQTCLVALNMNFNCTVCSHENDDAIEITAIRSGKSSSEPFLGREPKIPDVPEYEFCVDSDVLLSKIYIGLKEKGYNVRFEEGINNNTGAEAIILPPEINACIFAFDNDYRIRKYDYVDCVTVEDDYGAGFLFENVITF